MAGSKGRSSSTSGSKARAKSRPRPMATKKGVSRNGRKTH